MYTRRDIHGQCLVFIATLHSIPASGVKGEESGLQSKVGILSKTKTKTKTPKPLHVYITIKPTFYSYPVTATIVVCYQS